MPHHPPQPSTALHEAQLQHSLRWLTGLVVTCLLLQALLLPAQRTAARMHVHMGPVWAQLWAGAWAGIAWAPSAEAGQQDPAARTPRPLFVHASSLDHAAAQAQAHSHAHPASHDHTGHDGDDAVVLSSHDSEDPASAAAVLKRHLFDHDTVGSQPLAWATAAAAQGVASEAALQRRSHIDPPLERPPRARG